MNKQNDRIKKVRISSLGLVSNLSDDQLNEVPAGFSNNIIWNLGHLISAQQGICYVRAGLKPVIDEQSTVAYRPGTKPEKYIDSNEIENIKEVLLSSLEQFDEDYKNNLFTNYNRWTTRYGVELVNIDDALDFLLFHEGFHTGYILALRKMVNRQQ